LDKPYEQLRQELHRQVMEKIDVTREVDNREIYRIIDDSVIHMGEEQYIPLSTREKLRRDVFNGIRKLDVLQDLLEDPSVTEIMINGYDHIFIEKDGWLQETELAFQSREKLEDVIQQIVAGANRIVNESTPIVDARLPDGSRVNVVLSPIALDGSTITIRKFPERVYTMEDLIAFGSLERSIAERLRLLVMSRYNIFVSGGTGSGKTTFLNSLAQYIPGDERIITIEDSAELKITTIPNLIRMETRNANLDGKGAISMGQLIKTCLRMRPDRVIIGEVRGPEALDMLQAMNTGHDGSLSTGHANSASDMLSRLETMVLMGIEMPLPAIRQQIGSAIDLLVHLGRMRDRTRKVVDISEVLGYNNGQICLNPLYRFVETGEVDGKVEGRLAQVGSLQQVEKLKSRGYYQEFMELEGEGT
jgi:pilus assembly protein CpaF